MTDTLVDPNVLIDVWSVGSLWADWSMSAIAAARLDGDLVINKRRRQALAAAGFLHRRACTG